MDCYSFHFDFIFFGVLTLVLANTYEIAIASRFLIGIGSAGVYVPAMKIISVWFRQNEFATVTAVLVAIGNLGAIVSAYPLALAIELFGWRRSLLIVALVTPILVLLAWKFVRDAPGDFRGDKIKGEDIRLVLSNFSLWLIAISAMFRIGGLMGFQGLWGGPFLMDVYKMSKSTAGAILVLVSVGMIVGGIILGRISDLFGLRKLVLILAGFGLTLAWLPLATETGNLDITSICLISFSIGFFSSTSPIGYAIIKDLFPPRVTGLSISIANVFPILGASLFQPVMGYLMDLVGKVGPFYPVEAYKLSFEFCFIASILSVLALVFVKEKKT